MKKTVAKWYFSELDSNAINKKISNTQHSMKSYTQKILFVFLSLTKHPTTQMNEKLWMRASVKR